MDKSSRLVLRPRLVPAPQRRLLFACASIFVVLATRPALWAATADPNSHVYVGTRDPEKSIVVYTVDSPPAVVTMTSGASVSGIAVDPLANLIFARNFNESTVLVFDALDLSRIPGRDIKTPAVNGGTVEIDPYRRLLFTHDGDDWLRAYSIDPSNYGQVVAETGPVPGYAGTDQNQLVLDYLSGALYSTPNEASQTYSGDPTVYIYDVSGMSFRGGTFKNLKQMTNIELATEQSVTLDVPSRRLFAQSVNSPKGVEIYDISSPFDPLLLGILDTHTSNRDSVNCGIHYLELGHTEVLLETEFTISAINAYDMLTGSASTLSLSNVLGVDFHPRDADSPDDDNDGLPDSVELGATGLVYAALQDSDSTNTTDPDLADTDGDGLADGIEDTDHNGRIDAGETDPTRNDSDGDGSNDSQDCEPLDPTISPLNAEPCDGIDNDCDGEVDEASDQDGDGASSCQGSGAPLDCDDTRPDVYPGSAEICDGTDQDCDGTVDEGFDQDNDGYASAVSCTSTGGTDCDDGDPAIHPGALEACDGVDVDCDGTEESDCGSDATPPGDDDTPPTESSDDGAGCTCSTYSAVNTVSCTAPLLSLIPGLSILFRRRSAP